MKHKRTILSRTTILAFLTFMFTVGLNYCPAQAANLDNSISLFPAQVRLEPVPAGQTTLQQLTFRNDTGETQTFQVEILDYRGIDEKNFEFVALGSTADSLKGMIDVTPTRFDLEDGQNQDLLVRIRPEEKRAPGQYKGVVFVGPISTQEDASVRVAGRVGSLFGIVVTNPLPPAESPGVLEKAFREPVNIAVAAFGVLFVLGVVAAVRNNHSRRRSTKKQDY